MLFRSMIRGVDSISSKIIEEREKNGLYKDFIDCITRLSSIGINKSALESLIRSGCLDTIGNRDQMDYYGWQLLQSIRKKQKRMSQFTSILDDDAIDLPNMSSAPRIDTASRNRMSVEYLELYSLKEE